MKHFSIKLLGVILLFSSCATIGPIKRYNESKSRFNNPPELMSNNYPKADIYRVYQRASTGYTPMRALRNKVEDRIDKFARGQNKSFIILGERSSNPPFVAGNFPRIEIVFVLIDKNMNTNSKDDKITRLEKLKKLLDDGALTKEEYEREKKKILDEND